MLTKVDAWLRLNAIGLVRPIGEVENALLNIDQRKMFEEERARYRMEIWDKVSAINNISAERLKSREDYLSDGEVYLIYIDDCLTYLQMHDPRQAGFAAMSKDSALTIANKQADELAWAAAYESIHKLLLNLLL